MRLLLDGITDESELFDLAKRLGVKLDGIITIQEAPKVINRNKTYIILLRRDHAIGHWVGYSKGDYFDSYGEPPPTSLFKFVDRYNNKQYQAVEQDHCGQWTLLYLYSIQKNRPDLLSQMTDLSF